MRDERKPVHGRRWHRAATALLLASIGLLAGCGRSILDLVPQDFVDGSYTVGLRSPSIVDQFVTPNWMREQPTFDIVKLDGAITVTSTSDDVVSLGPAQQVLETDDGWMVQFSWSGLTDGNHYWQVLFTVEGCSMAEAVDADLGFGPDGVWRVPLRTCVVAVR